MLRGLLLGSLGMLVVALASCGERRAPSVSANRSDTDGAAAAAATGAPRSALAKTPTCIRVQSKIRTGANVAHEIQLDDSGRVLSREITTTHPKYPESRQRFTFRWSPSGTLLEIHRVDTTVGEEDPETRSAMAFEYGPHGELAKIVHDGRPEDVTTFQWKGSFWTLPRGPARWAPVAIPFEGPSEELPQFLALRSTETQMAPLGFTGTVTYVSPPRSSGTSGSVTYDERGRMIDRGVMHLTYNERDQPVSIVVGREETTYTWEQDRLVCVSCTTLGAFTSVISYGDGGLLAKRVRTENTNPDRAEVTTYGYDCTRPAPAR